PIQYCLADGSGFETYHPVLILFVLSSDFDKKRLLTCYLCQQSQDREKFPVFCFYRSSCG
ncbi:hypothetical protein, partial [Planifilum fimeticola]